MVAPPVQRDSALVTAAPATWRTFWCHSSRTRVDQTATDRRRIADDFSARGAYRSLHDGTARTGDRNAYGDLGPPCRGDRAMNFRCATIAFPDGKATLPETAPGVDVAIVVAATEAARIIADGIREMPS
jgi:hypothetical protein